MSTASLTPTPAGQLRVWRICKQKYVPTCLSGDDARIMGGRWNSKGLPAVYTSASLSLATLEMFVHVDPADVPANLVAVPVLIPSGLVRPLKDADLPDDWRVFPTPESTQKLGDDWLQSKAAAVLSVPSAVVPQERNYVINPTHADAASITIEAAVPFTFDSRMWKT